MLVRLALMKQWPARAARNGDFDGAKFRLYLWQQLRSTAEFVVAVVAIIAVLLLLFLAQLPVLLRQFF